MTVSAPDLLDGLSGAAAESACGQLDVTLSRSAALACDQLVSAGDGLGWM
jgi:hypothetical protein